MTLTRIQLRRDTAANWTASNSVLAEGEPAVELGTFKRKIGDGVTAWNDLPYVSGGSGGGTWGQITGAISEQDDLATALSQRQLRAVDGGFWQPGTSSTNGTVYAPGVVVLDDNTDFADVKWQDTIGGDSQTDPYNDSTGRWVRYQETFEPLSTQTIGLFASAPVTLSSATGPNIVVWSSANSIDVTDPAPGATPIDDTFLTWDPTTDGSAAAIVQAGWWLLTATLGLSDTPPAPVMVSVTTTGFDGVFFLVTTADSVMQLFYPAPICLGGNTQITMAVRDTGNTLTTEDLAALIDNAQITMRPMSPVVHVKIPALPPDGSVTPTLYATLDLVAAQPTSTGRLIQRLRLDDDRLYAAYGDYTANTGPIHVLSMNLINPADDPTTVAVISDEATLHTEATWEIKPLSKLGGLTIPFLDPQGSDDPSTGQYATQNPGSQPRTWTTHTNLTPVAEHVFDTAQTAAYAWMCGASFDDAEGSACIWRSADGGTTWAAALTVPSATGFARFYTMMVFDDDTLLAVLTDNDGPAEFVQAWHCAPGASTFTQLSSDIADAWRGASDATPFTVNPSGTLPLHFAALTTEGKQSGNAPEPSAVAMVANTDHLAAVTAALPTGEVWAFYAGTTSLWSLALTSDDVMGLYRTDPDGTLTLLFPIHGGLGSIVSLAVDEPNAIAYFGTVQSTVLWAPVTLG